jgi:threonine dehydrogenase-like Zn-dependent dehydrogenase
LNDALKLVRSGGRVVTYSIYHDSATALEVGNLYHKEITVIGTKGGGGYYETAIRAVSSGQLRPEQLVTHKVSLEEAPGYISLAHEKPTDMLRVIFEV